MVENRAHLQELDLAWTTFIETEATQANQEVILEVAQINAQSTECKRLLESFNRRTRRQQSSIYEWSEGIHDVEITRVAHVRLETSSPGDRILIQIHFRPNKIFQIMLPLSKRNGQNN